MYEIRIHGRGGQGVKMSSRLLGTCAMVSGMEAQDFAVYGAERRGAPVAAFCRVSKEPIMAKGYIFEPDAVVVLDPTIGAEQTMKGLKKGGIAIVNSPAPLKEYPGAVFTDATRMAMEAIGRPIPNTAIIGGFVRLTGIFTLDNLLKAVKIELEEAGHENELEANSKACRKCWDSVKPGKNVLA